MCRVECCSNCEHYREMFEKDDYSGETFDVSWCDCHEVPIDDVVERVCEEYEER